jgi:hypothetical protein
MLVSERRCLRLLLIEFMPVSVIASQLQINIQNIVLLLGEVKDDAGQ